MKQERLSNNWWKEKLIEAFIYFWWKAENKQLKKYFIKNYSTEIFKSIKESSLDWSINWQLQFYSKSDWWKNYTNKYDLFHKIKTWLWALNENYKEELNKFENQKQTDILFYKWNNWNLKINVFLKDETLWLSQKMMAELFWVQENNITYHIKEIYNSEELDNNSTTQKIWVVQKEWNREVKRNIINIYP